MNNLKTSCKVCIQNVRKWKGDYKVLLVLIFILIVNNYHASWFINFATNLGENNKIAPWIYVFAFTGWGLVKIMMLLPLLLLFSNAPFIDSNQSFVIARCSRKVWCMGQVMYIVLASGIYVIISALSSIVMIFRKIEWTMDWGSIINTAAKSSGIEGALATGVNSDVVYYFSPTTALLYTVLLEWFACVLIGLSVYAVNSLTGRTGYGVLVGGGLIFFDYVQDFIRTATLKYDVLSYFSPISWCSIDVIDISKKKTTPSITFVLCAYVLLIFLLMVVVRIISKKQEVKVIENE